MVRFCTSVLKTPSIEVPRSSKLSGTTAPASFSAAFLAREVSLTPAALAPACPNWN